MKVGDLVRIDHASVRRSMTDVGGMSGIVWKISDPTPMWPYRIASVIFAGEFHRDISCRHLGVVSEAR